MLAELLALAGSWARSGHDWIFCHQVFLDWVLLSQSLMLENLSPVLNRENDFLVLYPISFHHVIWKCSSDNRQRVAGGKWPFVLRMLF